MIDFKDIPEELIRARGQYATVRSALDDEMRNMQTLCAVISSRSASVLRDLQEGHDVKHVLDEMRDKINQMETSAKSIKALQAQRAELKSAAWS